MNKKSKIIVALVILITIIGGSYAWLTYSNLSKKTNVIKVGTFSLLLDDTTTEGINIDKAVPESDEDGLKRTTYKFKVINEGSIAARYQLFLDDYAISEGKNRIPDTQIKYNLKRNDDKGSPALLSSLNNRELDSNVLAANSKVEYELNLWIDSKAGNDVLGKEFAAKLRLYAEQLQKDPKYMVSGKLADSEGNPLTGYVAVMSTPKIVKLNNDGSFIVPGLEEGNHTIYYTGNTNPTGMNKDQIEEKAITKGTFTTNSTSISLSNGYQMKNTKIGLDSDSSIYDPKLNSNIKKVMKYDQTAGSSTFCVNGEEATCQEENSKSFTSGTIIKYAVNSTEDKYFYVLHDYGDKVEMQQRENTVGIMNWSTTAWDVSTGPNIILPALENATNGWTNVNDLNYTIGQDVIYKTKFISGSSAKPIVFNSSAYVSSRNAKARLITALEAQDLGCGNKCPNYLINYLNSSTVFGGNYNNSTGGYGYWTLSSVPSGGTHAYPINQNSKIETWFIHMQSNYGGRAVVEINKYS